MSHVALGAYLQRLRAARGWTRAEAIAALQAHSDETTSESQILRIERGEQNVRAALLVALLRVLGANSGQAIALLADQHADANEGRRAANAWLDPGKQSLATLLQWLTSLPGEQQHRILNAALHEAATRR